MLQQASFQIHLICRHQRLDEYERQQSLVWLFFHCNQWFRQQVPHWYFSLFWQFYHFQVKYHTEPEFYSSEIFKCMIHIVWLIRTSFKVSTMDKSAPTLGFPSAECTISLQFFKRILFIFWVSLDIWIRSIGIFLDFHAHFELSLGFTTLQFKPCQWRLIMGHLI